MPAGRPSKYDPAFCDVVIAAGDDGETIVGMAELCGVHRETLRDWMEKYPEFSAAVKSGMQRSQVWWERQGRLATFGAIPGFNPTSYIFNMKNRFKEDWRDKVEQDLTSSDGSMKPQQIIIRAADANSND